MSMSVIFHAFIVYLIGEECFSIHQLDFKQITCVIQKRFIRAYYLLIKISPIGQVYLEVHDLSTNRPLLYCLFS